MLHGDCRSILPTLDAESFDCVVTSPPYWGLRDFGVEGQIGSEPTLDTYVKTLVGVFGDLRRVLKQSGTAWLNLGETYKAKQLLGVPWRVALALQTDGWWLRSAIVWHKPNPMPESVIDRPTSAYEMMFLLTKGERYFYDADAIAEPSDPFSIAHGKKYGDMPSIAAKGNPDRNDNGGRGKHCGVAPGRETRNARNVWTIASQPFKGSHFATMPPDLAERCIKAGCPRGGHVLDPFAGAGTTGLVADRLGRHAMLIELSPAYRDMGADRIMEDSPLFADVLMQTSGEKPHHKPHDLFDTNQQVVDK